MRMAHSFHRQMTAPPYPSSRDMSESGPVRRGSKIHASAVEALFRRVHFNFVRIGNNITALFAFQQINADSARQDKTVDVFDLA